jgi:hypothetical protein
MISQLVRTKFESNLMSFIVFIALIAYAGVRYVMTGEVPDAGNPTGDTVLTAYALLVVFCMAAGLVSLLRQNRERSTRLYAQLPVSPRQIRVAYWLHASLYPGIAALMLLAFVMSAGSVAASGYLWPVMLFFHVCLLLACFSLVTSNIARVIPEAVRRITIVYCIVVAVATVGLGASVAFAAVTLIGEYEGPESLPKLIVTMAIVCVALVALDINSFGKKDHNLG